ncbi:MAG: hypothetical protein AMXMBFR47_11860 [Planctomycetota bacterium]
MPLKWLILGAFVAGFTIANVVNATRNNSTSGCTFFDSNDSAANANGDDSSSGRDQPGDSTSNSNSAAQDNTNGSDASENANGAPANSNSDAGPVNENTNSGDTGGNSNSNSAPANENANSGDDQSNSNAASNTNENGDDTSPAITGRYAGTLRRENAQSLGGDLPPPRVTNSSQAMEFAENFRPLVIMVINYAGAPDRPLTSVRQGERQTLTATLGSKQITMEVTVREASYQRRQMRAVLDIAYSATSGNLSETGTGEQIIECSLDASGNLTISSGVHYEVRLTAGAIIFNTIEETSMTGTLNRE